MSRRKKVARRDERPLANEKRVVPSPQGTRAERRLASRLERKGYVRRPSSAEELLERIYAIPNWRTANTGELARRTGVVASKIGLIRQVLLGEEQKGKEST